MALIVDQGIALFSATVSVVGLLFVGIQVRDSTRQRRSDSLVKILDINRELIALGFSHPQLFAILADRENVDPLWTQRYLQLWLNQFSLVHSYLEHSMLGGEVRDNLLRDISEFVQKANVRKHWHKFGHLYPASFQDYINEVLKKDEPPTKAAHHEHAHTHHDSNKT